MRNFYKNLKNLILVTLLMMGSVNAWGNSVSSANSSSDISNGKIVMNGNHATFTFAATGKTISHNGINYSGFSVGKKSTLNCPITWTANGGNIIVTKISVNVTGYAVTGTSSVKAVFNGTTSNVGSAWGTMTTMTASNNSGLSSGIQLQLKNEKNSSVDYYITSISFTYTITPNAPTIKASTATVNVSLSSDNPTQLDMTNVITVSDVNDFMPVAFESNSFNDPQGVSSTGAYTFTGKYFYATKAGVYTFTKPYITEKTNCHTASSKTNGTVTITVNRLNQTLTMTNGSVDVTTDKSNPNVLDLSTLKTQTGNGAVTYSLVSGPTSVDGKSAANNCSISGNNFYAWVGGTYTLKATAAATAQYNSKESSNFTVTVNRLTQNIAWSTSETVFVEEDVISATSIGTVTLERSGAGASYVTIDGNTATVGEVESNASVTLTATAAQTDVYAEATDSKTINLTSLQKQHITFDQNLTKLKTTDSPRKVELVATSDSNRDNFITFTVSANSDGVTVTQENGKWYLNYPAAACKNIMVTAHLDGVAGTYVPASDVSQMVKVTDPTAKCDNTESLATASSLCNTSKTYNLTVPKKVVLKVRCSKSKIYANGYNVKFYNAQNQQVGSTQSFDGHTWDQSVYEHTFDNLDKSITKMVFTSNASNGFDITEASYERWYYANPSVNALNYEAYALSTVADQSLTISYANYQVELSIEGSSNFVLKSDDSFGDCETYGTQTVTIGYNVPAQATEEQATLYIKDNTGKQLATVALNANVLGGLTQNITSTNIANSYKTTDKVTLTAETDRGLTNFSYSASPAGIASFAGNIMTFNQSGTIAITVTEAGNSTFIEATTTVENVVVSKVTPNIVSVPAGTAVTYLQNLSASTLSGGSADVTLRGVEYSAVAGSWKWTNKDYQVVEAAGSHSYGVTFTPTDGGMYNANTTGSVSITVNKAAQTISMNNGTVKVSVEGIDAGKSDSYLDLNSLIASQTNDPVNNNRVGAVTYEVISANSNKATISGSTFSATVCGTYTIRATKAATAYYNAATADFTVTVGKRANTLVTAGPYTKYVDDEIATVATVINSDGAIHTSSSDATIAYYDIANNKIVIPNSEAKSFDQTTVSIKIWQDATARFEASAEKTVTVTVKKYDNEFACSWGSFAYTANFEEIVPVVFTTNNTDYTHFPIGIAQTSGATIATLANNDATHNTITASYSIDDATWHLSQAESYKYKATEHDVTVHVRKLTSGECSLFEDNTEHEFETKITDISGHYDTPIPVSGHVDKIYFEAKKDLLGVNNFIVEYSVDNGTSWRTIAQPELYSSYQTYGPYNFEGLAEDERVSHIRFGATTGATYSKYYKNIRVTRKTSVTVLDKDNNALETLTMDQNTIGGTTTAKFYIDYNTCADYVKVASDNSHFTLDKSAIEVDPTKDFNRAEVTVTYSSNEQGPHQGTITVYTPYENVTFTVQGTTDKKIQTLDWKAGYTSNPLVLPLNLRVDNTNLAVTASSDKSVIFTSSDENVIEIIMNGLGFRVAGPGTATLTASEPGDDYWFPVSETKTVNVTQKGIQEIVWTQDFIRNMVLDKQMSLDAKVYIRNMSTGELTYNEGQTATITYSCEDNNGVITVDGNVLTVVGYGQTTVTAHVDGNDNFEEALPVSMIVKVVAPSTGCPTPWVLDQSANVQLFSMDMQLSGGFGDWTTPEINSDPILLDAANGKPDKLSYQHNGELYTVPGATSLIKIQLCRGTVKAQERVNGVWYDIEGSSFNNGGKEGSEGYYNWRQVENLQLNENADAIRFVRLANGQGYHNFKDIQVSLKHYVRPTNAIVELGDIEIGEARPITVGIDYSDVKQDLYAEVGDAEDPTYTVDENNIHVECGSHGHKDIPVTITPTELGEWSNTIQVLDKATNEITTITIVANVTLGIQYIFTGGENTSSTGSTVWNNASNWDENNKPGENDAVLIESNVEITGDVKIGSLTIAEGVTVTVTVSGSLTLGDGQSKMLNTYGDLHVLDGGEVTVGSGTLIVRDLILDANLGKADGTAQGSSGQFVDEQSKLWLERDAYFQMSFDPSGQITYGWYDFVVPFEVNTADGIFRLGETEHLVSGTDFIVMEHSEEARARGQKDWKVFNGTMQPGKVYTITFDDEVTQNTFLFKKKQDSNISGTDAFSAHCSTGDDDKRGWNGLGNGTLQHKRLAASGKKVQLYDHTNNVYVTREADDYNFAVGTSFFMQVDGEQTIQFDAAGNRPLMAPGREGRNINEFRLSLTEEDAAYTADQLWFSASEDATDAYVIGHDLLKFGDPKSAKQAQMWVVKGGKVLCDAEVTMVNNNASSPLMLFAPHDGQYTLAVDKAPEDAMLYLTYNDRIIWNLSYAPYAFDLTKGTTEGYGLRIVATAQITTDLENDGLMNNADGVRKVIIDNMIYLVMPDGKMYDITGKSVKY